MHQRLRVATTRAAERDGGVARPPLLPLRLLAAQLLLVTGIGSTVELVARTRADRYGPFPRQPRYPDEQRTRPRPAAWAPALIAPLAALAHVVHGTRPNDSNSAAVRLLDAASVGAGLAAVLTAGRGGRLPALSPLALASAGLLGLLVDRQARAAEAERRRLRRRAAVAERLLPRPRARLDRIVVHV